MATKTIKAWINGTIQYIEVEDIVYPEQPISVEKRVDTLEDKHEVVFTDGNLLVGNGTEELEEMTPEEVLSHINGANIVTLTTAEYEALGDNINANTLYIPTDGNNVDVYVQNDEPTEAEEGALWLDVDAEGDNEPQIYIDDSLSITGQAADAKAVGDALATKQPIGNYATENYVTTKIAEAELSGSDVDLSGYATKDDIPTKTSELTNDSSFITASGAPVQSVNGKTGTVNLVASDIGALPNTTVIPTVPTNVSAFTNDAGYLTEHQSLEDYAKTADLGVLATKDSIDESYLSASIQEILGLADTALQSYTETDPTVPTWAKASTKPTYTKSEVGLGNVDNVKQYSASNPPPYPVTSVNGMTGDVEGAVLYTEQTLTEAQKAQARNNIGAMLNTKIPEATVSDAGKFLRVSSTGDWAIEAVPRAEEVAF